MKAESKVVTMTTARQLAAAGWSEPTAWVWAEVKPGRVMLVRVARLIPHERSQYPLYPAPDVSELLEALSSFRGCLELSIHGGVEAALVRRQAMERLTREADTPANALAQLWCVARAEWKD